ncbi:uncharacterized protein LOC123717859 [Pieris brassicae]|uniref:uncharacterized protein LOC123717859 n=1 Tax=Pieris brassicae TaxID=7116 RepID=UPI001E6624A6|nr:uncharacterized protein LOC123717859 [Pieris brassicae]
MKYIRKTQNQDITEKEIYKLLILLRDCDTNLQTQIILALGSVLFRNNKQREIIIKHDPLYETLSKYLNKGQQIGLTLKFISALLYIDMKEGPTRRKSLYIYGQNMIRISGCLSALRILFVSMMQRELWIALCRCLADVCRGCVLNQTFCSDLIPMCITFCRRDTFVIVFLQSLLEGHEKNNRLFHLNNGMSIFTRESMYNTQYLQLLNTVIENVTEDGNNFYPISTSTPKRDRTLSTITKIYENRKITKRPKKYKVPNKVNRSLSIKFLDVVNSSCTTIIKSIKSVFTRNTSVKQTVNEKCGSFTEYMRIRDQYLSDISKSSPDVKSCMTCNDTLLLKEKLVSDDCLKVTVKKLKHGINMFGCDFKKISKTFWPHKQCMTPAVLYNLYRKLLIK